MLDIKALLLFAAFAAAAQTPAFDAASIRPNTSQGGISAIRITAGRASMENCSLKKIMLNAYGIPDDREYMIDGPEWLTSEHFDIEAKFPADKPVTQIRQMLQTMLADRFRLTLHKETRQLPMYSLVVAKGGPKIHAGEGGDSRTSGRPGHFEATKITMPKLADLIAKQAGRPVTDATGLQGVFDFTLEWSPQADLRVGTADAAPADNQGPSIFTALQEQLGLRLESGKGPVEVLVVDRMEKMPTEN
jgi:uncharacterized protein (TIGR03435 family)